MPVPLTPDEAAALPGAYVDLLDAVSFRSAAAASRLGIFEALAAGPGTAAEVAARTGTDPLGVRVLLDALAGYGYVDRNGDVYANTPGTTRWLLPGPDSFVPVLNFWSALLTGWWTDLEDSIRRGGPGGDFYAGLDQRPEVLADFHTMLRRLAGHLGKEIVELTPAGPDDRSLLDLGGGHAAYTVAFLRDRPDLRATVVDLPGALTQGARTVEDAGLSDRVSWQPGDLFTAGLGHDVVLLCNIVHGFRPDDVRRLLRRVAAAMRPGGCLTLLEPLAEVPGRGPGPGDAFVRMFSLNLFHTQGGRAYDLPELRGLLTEAGFTDVRDHALAGSDTDHVVTACRAA